MKKRYKIEPLPITGQFVVIEVLHTKKGGEQEDNLCVCDTHAKALVVGHALETVQRLKEVLAE